VNRSATFVFNIGERFFGSMTAYVHGPESAHYDFTSALPVQLLVTLAPSLMPLIEKQDTVMIPGAHVTVAAPLPAGGAQLFDDVATMKAAPDDAQAEEVEVLDAKPAAQAEAVKAAAKPASEPATKPAKAEAAHAGAQPKAAAPKAAEAQHAKPTDAKPADTKPAEAKRSKPSAAEDHPKAVDTVRAKPAAPRAKPRSEDADAPKTEPSRPKPAAVEEVLH
jgi:hypothetical protein